jgi:uncharacterized cupredoxin-like copper-binding protein
MVRRSRERAGQGPAAVQRLVTIGCAVLAMLAIGFGRTAAVTAQDASPVPVECKAPKLPPGTPTAPINGSPAAETPAGEETTEPAASPVVGTPADEETTAAAAAAVQNIANCINSGDLEGAAALFTPNMIMALTGGTNPYDAVAALEGFTITDLQTGDAETYPDGRVSIDVTYIQYKYQFVHERWWLVQDGEYWKLDGFDTLTPEPEGDTTVVGVALGAPDNEYSITPNTSSVTQNHNLIFHVTNGGQEAHMMAVLSLPEGATIEQVMQDESLQAQTEFIAALDYLAPGESQDLALVNLPAGEYTLICFFEAPDGKTHAEHGMVTTFTVNPPA